jgi:Raf kinase inhibitor-like YbhB/YbcL family protein
MRAILFAGLIACIAAATGTGIIMLHLRAGARGAENDDPTGGKAMTISITSTAFEAGKTIPKEFTGEDDDRSPPLAWSNIPQGTKEIALLCDDPDAPAGTWVHWVLYKIPPETAGLPEGLPREKTLKTPAGAVQGVNSFGSNNVGYRGPMPPPGHGTHHYHFKIYALDKPVSLSPGESKKALLAEIHGHVLAQGELIGTYKR